MKRASQRHDARVVVITVGALVMAAGALAAPPREPPVHEHHFIADYRGALSLQLDASERGRLEAIDTSATDRAALGPLLYLAADHAIRRIAPLALEALRLPAEAVRLRRLPPIRDRRSARPARDLLLEVAPLANRMSSESAVPRPLGVCEQPLTHASLMARDVAGLKRGEEPSGTGAASVACGTIEAGANRAVVVGLALDLLRDLAAAARAEERPRRR